MAAEGDGAPSREDGYGTSFEVPMPERRPLPTGMSLATYAGEQDLPPLVDLFEADLSEPYSVFTYRYFVNTWPDLCLIVRDEAGAAVASIVAKLDVHKKGGRRGYIAMLAVAKAHRGKGLGTLLVVEAIRRMMERGCDEVVLETEESNRGARRLYENLGFVRDKKLPKYYLNGGDAFRLKLWLRPFVPSALGSSALAGAAPVEGEGAEEAAAEGAEAGAAADAGDSGAVAGVVQG